MMTVHPASSTTERIPAVNNAHNTTMTPSSTPSTLPMSTGLADFAARRMSNNSSQISNSRRLSISMNQSSSRRSRSSIGSSGSNTSLSSLSGIRLVGSASVMGLSSVRERHKGEDDATDDGSMMRRIGSSIGIKKSGSKLKLSTSANALADAVFGGSRRVKKVRGKKKI